MRKKTSKTNDKELLSVPTVSPIPEETTSVANETPAIDTKSKNVSLTSIAQANTEKQHKKDKPKKVKMIRDSFTMPESEYNLLTELKKKCLENGVHVKKSELIRAGLINLSRLNKTLLLKAVERVEIIKTGRPKA